MACTLCLPIHGGYEEDHDQEGDEGIKRVKEEEEGDHQKQRLNGDGDGIGDGDGGDGHLKRVFDAFDVNRDGVVTVEELCEWMERLGLHITEDGMRDMVKKTCGHEGDRLRFEEFRAFADTLQSEKARLPRRKLRFKDANDDDDGMSDRTCPKEKIEPTNHASADGSKKIDKDVKSKDYGAIVDEDEDQNQDLGEDQDQDQDDDDDDDDIREAFRVFDKNGDGLISPSDLRSTLSGLGMLSSSTSFRRIHSMIRRVDTDHDGYVSLPEFKSMIKNNK